MKTKKTLSYLMALVLSFTMLTSCSNENKPAETDNNKDQVEDQAKTDEESKEDSEEKPEEEVAEKPVDEGGHSPATGGTYEGIAPGYGGDVKVSVEMGDQGEILDINILEDNETSGVGKVALEKVLGRIIEGQSTNVEAVTGATASSKGLMLAVGKALDEAGVADNFKEEYKEKREYPSEI